MSSSRQRPTSSLPKPPTNLHPSCVIADSAVLTGTHPITIGADTILHPRAKIVSSHGPVTIGKGCIISEKAVVGLQAALEPGSSFDGSISLGDDVVLETASIVEGSIGDGTCIEAGAKVCAGARVGEYCKVAPLCTVPSGEELADYEIVFGNNQRRKEKPGLEALRKITHDKEVQMLRKLVPSNLAKWQTVGNVPEADGRSARS